MKLSRLIPAIAAVGGAVAFAVYKMQKNKKEIMKLDEGLLTDEEEETLNDFHIDDVKSTADMDDVDVDIPAFKEQKAQESAPYVLDEETKAKISAHIDEAIKALGAVQDVHTAERPIEHQMSFTNEADMNHFKESVVKRGYVVTKGENENSAVCMHIAPMDKDLMMQHVTYLFEETKNNHGTYEGWHCDPVY